MVRGFFHSDRAPHSSRCGVWLASTISHIRCRPRLAEALRSSWPAGLLALAANFISVKHCTSSDPLAGSALCRRHAVRYLVLVRVFVRSWLWTRSSARPVVSACSSRASHFTSLLYLVLSDSGAGCHQTWVTHCVAASSNLSNTTREPDAGTMLGQRRRRWSNIERASDHYLG